MVDIDDDNPGGRALFEMLQERAGRPDPIERAMLETTAAQRQHAEAAITAIGEQKILMQRIADRLDQVGTRTGPTEYELWRDAMQLAATTVPDGDQWSTRVLLENAEWFHDRLKAGPPQPPEPACSHCGADSSMDHDDGCPNGDYDVNDPTNHGCDDCGTSGADPIGHMPTCIRNPSRVPDQ